MHATDERFASLPDLFNIFRAVTVLALSLLVLDYILVAPNLYGTFFFGKITIALYWMLQIVLLSGSRIAYRYFRYTRTRHHARSPESNPTLILGLAADSEVLLRGIQSGEHPLRQIVRRVAIGRARSAALVQPGGTAVIAGFERAPGWLARPSTLIITRGVSASI